MKRREKGEDEGTKGCRRADTKGRKKKEKWRAEGWRRGGKDTKRSKVTLLPVRSRGSNRVCLLRPKFVASPTAFSTLLNKNVRKEKSTKLLFAVMNIVQELPLSIPFYYILTNLSTPFSFYIL